MRSAHTSARSVTFRVAAIGSHKPYQPEESALLKETVAWDTDSHCWDDLIDDGLRSVYAAYARPLGIGRFPAVLAIDLYKRAFAGGAEPPQDLQNRFPSSCGRYAHEALPSIRRVFSAARAVGVPVLHATVDGGAAGAPTNRHEGSDGTDGWAFHPDCEPSPGEIVVPKARASAFYGTPLVSDLVRLGVDTLVIVGETTSGCVRASAVDAYSHGFHVVVVEDAVFDRSWLSHRVNLFDMHHKYADVMSSGTLCGLLAPGFVDVGQ
jgi:maleamate amidohydrolase